MTLWDIPPERTEMTTWPKASDCCHCWIASAGDRRKQMKNLQNLLDSSVRVLSRAALCFIVLSICGHTKSTFGQSASYDIKGPNSASSQLLPELLPREKEIELALSAAPEHLRKGAGVYVLERNGFVKVRDSTNGFTCIVNRDHPLNQKPVCFDTEGTATISPKILQVGELLMQGKTMSEINGDIAKGFRTGKYISPRRPGVAYMLSGDIRNFNPRTGKVESFPPHIRFYAPNLTNADLGTTAEALAKDPSLPFVAYQGPHGFIIVLTGDKQKVAMQH